MGWKTLLIAIFAVVSLVACNGSPADAPAPTAAAQMSDTGSPAAAASASDAGAPTTQPGTESSQPEPTSETGSVAPASSVPQGHGKRGGTLVRLFSDPPTLDPHLTTDNISGALVNEIYGGLVTLSPELAPSPDLAEKWDVSEDGTVYTFHLRENAKFHNGKPVTSEDVRWSLERAADPATTSPVAEQYLSDILGVTERLAGEADSIRGVRVIDDRTIELTIDAPKAYFLAKLTYPTSFVVDRENVEADPQNWTQNPNGTGPFTLDEYIVGERMVLARYEDYHLEPAFLDKVDFNLAGGDAMIMYENDELHLTGVGLADLERVKDPSEPLNADLVQADPSFSTSYIGMNVTIAPLDDPKVRQALNYTVNREGINTAVYDGLLVPGKGILPPGFPAYNPDLRGYEYDPEKARQLLLESSYGDNLDDMPLITLSISGSFGADLPLDMEVMLKEWEELGLKVEIQQTEWATYLQDLHDRRYQMFRVGWGADYPDPENFLDILFHSESDNNHTGYSNPEVDALLEQARVERDRMIRFALYNQAEQKIMDDAPWIPLWHSGERYVLIKPEVKDYLLTPLTLPKYRYVYIENQ